MDGEDSDPLRRIKENDPSLTSLFVGADEIQNFTNEDLEELGRDISNNTHLTDLDLHGDAAGDQSLSFLFRGLARSSSIKSFVLSCFPNDLSAAGVQSMLPFLQNADNLVYLKVYISDIQSEGFNLLLRALRNSLVGRLECKRCGIDLIEIDSENTLNNLTQLNLNHNFINADGCRELAKLLQRGDSTLKYLHLDDNEIGDDGVEILVDALQSNTSLIHLGLEGNDGISNRGQILLLKLVNDVSSINATLQSNHTLREVLLKDWDPEETVDVNEIQQQINYALHTNDNHRNHPEAAGREKVVWTQLHSVRRAALYRLQEVDHSVYSEIDPLHLPEVLSLIGRHHGQGELYLTLKSSIAGLFTRVNMKQCIQNEVALYEARIAWHRAIIEEQEAKLKELNARLATMDDSDQDKVVDTEVHNNKRRRL